MEIFFQDLIPVVFAHDLLHLLISVGSADQLIVDHRDTAFGSRQAADQAPGKMRLGGGLMKMIHLCKLMQVARS